MLGSGKKLVIDSDAGGDHVARKRLACCSFLQKRGRCRSVELRQMVATHACQRDSLVSRTLMRQA
jgi:hypothetical protein